MKKQNNKKPIANKVVPILLVVMIILIGLGMTIFGCMGFARSAEDSTKFPIATPICTTIFGAVLWTAPMYVVKKDNRAINNARAIFTKIYLIIGILMIVTAAVALMDSDYRPWISALKMTAGALLLLSDLLLKKDW